MCNTAQNAKQPTSGGRSEVGEERARGVGWWWVRKGGRGGTEGGGGGKGKKRGEKGRKNEDFRESGDRSGCAIPEGM